MWLSSSYNESFIYDFIFIMLFLIHVFQIRASSKGFNLSRSLANTSLLVSTMYSIILKPTIIRL